MEAGLGLVDKIFVGDTHYSKEGLTFVSVQIVIKIEIEWNEGREDFNNTCCRIFGNICRRFSVSNTYWTTYCPCLSALATSYWQLASSVVLFVDLNTWHRDPHQDTVGHQCTLVCTLPWGQCLSPLGCHTWGEQERPLCHLKYEAKINKSALRRQVCVVQVQAQLAGSC